MPGSLEIPTGRVCCLSIALVILALGMVHCDNAPSTAPSNGGPPSIFGDFHTQLPVTVIFASEPVPIGDTSFCGNDQYPVWKAENGTAGYPCTTDADTCTTNATCGRLGTGFQRSCISGKCWPPKDCWMCRCPRLPSSPPCPKSNAGLNVFDPCPDGKVPNKPDKVDATLHPFCHAESPDATTLCDSNDVVINEKATIHFRGRARVLAISGACRRRTPRGLRRSEGT